MPRIAFLLSFLVFFAIQPARAQIGRFQHVVVVVQENRTPDNLFQGVCGSRIANRCSTTPTSSQYNIQQNNWLDKTSSTGVTQPRTVPLDIDYDLSHAHVAFSAMCDANASGNCTNDGAANVLCGGNCDAYPKPQFRYVDNSTGLLDPYVKMAQQYGFANYMFQTNQGPSFPAHQFLFGGTSAPNPMDDAIGTFAAENMSFDGNAGCIGPSNQRVSLINSVGDLTQSIYPCFEHQTIPDLLPSTVTWRYYAPDAGSIWAAPDAISHLCQSTGPDGKCTGTAWTNNVELTPANVLTDISGCKLRSLSWVIPTGVNSDHANANDGGGPSWVTSIVNAIGNSTACDSGTGYWNNTAVIVTWDDWGGWYDHEPPTILPPPQGMYQYGFRVPLLFISAYTPVGYIDNGRYDFGSILRFVESNFGLTPGGLNFADARAASGLSTFFDLTRSPRQYETIAAPKDASYFIHDKRPPTDPDDDDDFDAAKVKPRKSGSRQPNEEIE